MSVGKTVTAATKTDKKKFYLFLSFLPQIVITMHSLESGVLELEFILMLPQTNIFM